MKSTKICFLCEFKLKSHFSIFTWKYFRGTTQQLQIARGVQEQRDYTFMTVLRGNNLLLLCV